MQENNENGTTKNSSKSSTKQKKPSLFSEVKSEFKKITWPNRQTLTKQTFTVIVISFVVGLIIFGYDFGIDFILQKLVEFMA